MARVKLHNAGFRALRKSPEVRRLVQEIAEEMAADAGSGVAALETKNPRNRARFAVVGPARKQDAILRALGSRMGRS